MVYDSCNSYNKSIKILNLIINGLPSIYDMINHLLITDNLFILNLIINGLPSIWNSNERSNNSLWSFKPYYKWITFNIYRGT